MRMGYVLLAFFIVALPTGAAAAEKSREPPQRAQTVAPPPVTKSNPCAMYGAGFVLVEGTSTCVKIGGHVTIDVGGTR